VYDRNEKIGFTARSVLGFLRHVARQAGVVDGRGGAVVTVQRFGGAMNLNVHFHALVLRKPEKRDYGLSSSERARGRTDYRTPRNAISDLGRGGCAVDSWAQSQGQPWARGRD